MQDEAEQHWKSTMRANGAGPAVPGWICVDAFLEHICQKLLFLCKMWQSSPAYALKI